MAKQTRRSHLKGWAWWRVAVLGLAAFGGFALALTVIPFPSTAALAVGAIIALIGMGAFLWYWLSSNWWARLVYVNALLLLMYGLSIRAWLEIIPPSWLWLLPLAIAYLIAWTLPVVNWSISSILVREQTVPETRLGRGCLALALLMAPVAAGLGGTFGIYGTRYGYGDAVILVVAVGLCIVTLALAHHWAHGHWQQRPWASRAETS